MREAFAARQPWAQRAVEITARVGQPCAAGERAALCAEAIAAAASTWRTEALRAVLAAALVDDDEAVARAAEQALPAGIACEERLAVLLQRDPVAALEAAEAAILSVTGLRRLVRSAGALVARGQGDPVELDAIAHGLARALAGLPSSLACVEAVRLAQIYAGCPAVDVVHLLALATVGTPSPKAQVALLDAVGAGLSARGCEEAAVVHAEAAAIAAEVDRAELTRLQAGRQALLGAGRPSERAR